MGVVFMYPQYSEMALRGITKNAAPIVSLAGQPCTIQ